ncbi:glycosyltransferase [Paenibacillus polymyxa]|uniref:glycosyltransferase n=1 Tax=Paenibacillus polymyxa TaxID=1406 RepID=UPI0023783CEC|nr:glycosyltransferase [Paenibacillus polymyxa]WDM21575.1 glycosyltransferase [Paenibacillus polymyxa]
MKIAVLLPCYNEELTIGQVIDDFKKELPEAEIIVYDNNSKDKTTEVALRHGATVKKEYRQGKGNVIASMFRDIDADIFIMADGDNTYPATSVHSLINPIVLGEADMVIGDRHTNGTYSKENKRSFHDFGNRCVRYIINKLFNAELKDIMSGYRAFNKKFVKNIPILSSGFEIETEMSIHALDKNFLVKEVPIDYRDRPEGSFSKLNTYSDGIKVLKTIFWLYKDYRPLVFFAFVSAILFVFGLIFGLPVILEFIKTRLIEKIPSAILSVGLMNLSFLSLACGFILDTIVKQHKQNYVMNVTYFVQRKDNKHE